MSNAMEFKQIEIDGVVITEKAQLEAFSTARLNQAYLELSGIERSSKDKSAAVNRLWRFLNPRNERLQEDTDMASHTKIVKKMLPKGGKEKKTTSADAVMTELGGKRHRTGSRKFRMHEFFLNKQPDRAAFIEHCVKEGLSASTASSWYQSFRRA